MQTKSLIIATAGHVDHGKTSLVNSLTGKDTDTLAEEKERGLTINLGYAYHHFIPTENSEHPCTLGFVDVPGHIDFINNMLAGVGAVNFALLVIAADDGIMPQTKEHLSIINLLGIKRGTIAVTKIDRVDKNRLRKVEQDINEIISESGLKNAPLFAVSSLTNEGIPELLDHLKTQTMSSRTDQENVSNKHFRYLVDRAFSVKGIGTVVTGSLQSGTTSINDHVAISSNGVSARIRGIRIDGENISTIESGQRAALNIDSDLESISRGDWLLNPKILRPTNRIDTALTLIDKNTLIKSGAEYHLYIGTSHHIVSLRYLDNENNFAQIKSKNNFITHHDDRFILRDPASEKTIGGGKVIDIFIPRKKRASKYRLNILSALNQDDMPALKTLIETSPVGVDLNEFTINRNLRSHKIDSLLNEINAANVEFFSFKLDKKEGYTLLLKKYLEEYKRLIITQIENFQERNSNLQGISETVLSHEIDFPGSHLLFHSLIRYLVKAGVLKLTGTLLHLPSHKISLSKEESDFLTKVRPLLEKSGNIPPRTRELAELTGIPLKPLEKILRQTTKSGSLIKVADNRYYLPETIMHLAEFTEQLMNKNPAEEGFSVIQFRDESEIGRNLCIEILEYFDRVGFTRRDGNTRFVRTEKENVFGQ